MDMLMQFEISGFFFVKKGFFKELHLQEKHIHTMGFLKKHQEFIKLDWGPKNPCSKIYGVQTALVP